MIKVKNLLKIYNKGKQNQINAIDNVTLEFGQVGLVSLLGPSGCGKTTLLNAISGLDKYSGTIDINGKQMANYNMSKWDRLRDEYIGYIFQNYILLPEETVFDNLKLVLRMYDLSKDEIKERIEYALKCVGMEKYQKRLCKNLSGGQMQRVSIARCLVKNPKIIIADEPTGNLDGKNTTQIMNIIRRLSKDRLVILVTHEKELAYFYSDRIIELLDGKVVKEYENNSNINYEYQDDVNIYLKEFKEEDINTGNVTYKLYSNELTPSLDIKVIYKDNMFYINATSLDSSKVRFVTDYDEVKLIDSTKPKLTLTEVDNLDIKIDDLSIKKRRSTINFIDTFLQAFNHVKSFRKKQKFFLFTFFVTAIFIVITFANLSNIYGAPKEKYVVANDEVIYCHINELDTLTLEEISKNINGYIIPSTELRCDTISNDFFNQSKKIRQQGTYVWGPQSFIPIECFKGKLLYGTKPSKSDEIVVDKFFINRILKSDSMIRYLGFTTYEQFINQTIDVKSYGINYTYKIVGISDNNSPTFYILRNELIRLSINDGNEYLNTIDEIDITTYKDLDGVEHNINELDLKVDEVLIDEFYSSEHFFIQDKVLKIVGTFNNDGNLKVIVNDGLFDLLKTNQIIQDKEFYLISNTPKKDLKYLEEYIDNIPTSKKLNEVYNLNQKSYKDYIHDEFSDYLFIIVFALISLVLSSIFMFLIMRSSLITRIYEVGVYRAIGIRRIDVVKVFISEILLITLLSSFLGYLLTSIVIWQINDGLKTSLISYPWYIALLALGFIIISNVIAGIIPISLLLRKTPTQILTKYDI